MYRKRPDEIDTLELETVLAEAASFMDKAPLNSGHIYERVSRKLLAAPERTAGFFRAI
jgi:hypothetical protein